MLASKPGTPLDERLERLIDQRGPRECWPWKGGKTRGGYGHMKIDGHYIRAARLVLHRELGLPLQGRWIARHSCDTPACCNPAHLLAGTQRQNVEDMHVRGRAAVGENMPTSKISEDQVREIRRRDASGESSVQISKDFDICYEQVRRIVRRKSWAWLVD